MAVKVTSSGNLNTLLKRIQKANLSEAFATETARALQLAVVENTQLRTGELEESIKVRKRANQHYGVYGAPYFWVVNDGRRPGSTIPPIHGKLGMWASSSALWSDGPMATRRLALAIAKYGTEPKHFYEKARARLAAKTKRIAKQKLRRI